MGSSPTLDPHPDDPEASSLAARALQAAGGRFHTNPQTRHPDTDSRHQQQRHLHDQQTRGQRAWTQEALENPPTPTDIRLAVLRDRAAAAQPTIRQADQAFDRLNPTFGVPADTHNPYGRQAVRDREAALALGVRVAVHDSRQNDRDPVIWQPGQDYRMTDAIHTARRDLVRTRRGPERTGPER